MRRCRRCYPYCLLHPRLGDLLGILLIYRLNRWLRHLCFVWICSSSSWRAEASTWEFSGDCFWPQSASRLSSSLHQLTSSVSNDLPSTTRPPIPPPPRVSMDLDPTPVLLRRRLNGRWIWITAIQGLNSRHCHLTTLNCRWTLDIFLEVTWWGPESATPLRKIS